MSFNRGNPSPRYRELLSQYRQLHEQGEAHMGLAPEKTFTGQSLLPHLGRIKALIDATAARTLLDYGCGKGQQYSAVQVSDASGRTYESVREFWDVDDIHRYDPGYAPFSVLPQKRFDGVICTDVLEHCPEQDVEWIVAELFGFADRFVYANVACFAAKKHLPNGENAHCTIQPAPWWEQLLARVSAKHPGKRWEVWVQTLETGPSGTAVVEERCLGS